MRQYTLSPRAVTRWTVTTLVQALDWSAAPTRLQPERLVQLLVRAAAALRSLSAMVYQAQAVPGRETVRRALLHYLPAQPRDLLPATTRALHRRLPKSLSRRPRTMAIDWHLRPFYGNPRTPGVSCGQPKAGTKYFFVYASLLVLCRGRSFTVGLTPVARGEEQTTVMARLLEQAQQAGLRVRRLLLDRGFYGATTIQWLQQRQVAFLMPMLRRGRKGRSKATSTGTQKFFVRGRRGWASYTWTMPRRPGRRHEKSVTVTVDVCMVPRPKGRKQRQKGPLVFASYRLPKMEPEAVRQLYRKRFGIETSYRQLGEGLASSCSTNAVYRFLLVAIALVLRNIWVWLHWQLLADRSGPRRRLQLQRLTLRRLTEWIGRQLDRTLQIRPGVLTAVI
jgi:Transposase DDE domain